MEAIVTVGIDLAKNIFQIHGVNAIGEVVLRKRLTRRKVLLFFAKLAPCLIGIEACCGSHFWARELELLGHTVCQMPPQYVKPYVKTNKNDANDAEAICEAVSSRACALFRQRMKHSLISKRCIEFESVWFEIEQVCATR